MTINFKILFFPCLLIIFSGSQIHSQSFMAEIQIADSLNRNGLYLEADSMYNTAFSRRTNVSYGFLYNAGQNNVLAGNYLKAIDQFTLAINGGLIDFDWILNNSKLKFSSPREWKILTNLIEEKEEKLNRELIDELRFLYEKDQIFRQFNPCKDQYSKIQNEIIDDLISQQDSLNVLEIIEEIKLNGGWLGKDVVGYEGNLTTWLIIQHANIAIQEDYVPLLEESVMNGQSQGEHLALLQDRILMKKGKKQIYGSQIKRNSETGKFYIYAIEDVTNVDKKRKSIGLSPINEYLKRWNITIEKDYVDEIK